LNRYNEQYSEGTTIIRKRYRFRIWFTLIAIILLIPVMFIFEEIWESGYWGVLIFTYMLIASLPAFHFASTRCPKCNKMLGFGIGKYTEFPKRCMHCGLSFLNKSGRLFWTRD